MWLKLSPLGKFYYIDQIVSNYRTAYRPYLSQERFDQNIQDIIYVYQVLQKNIIDEYGLSKSLYKNAVKLHIFKIQEEAKRFGICELSQLNFLLEIVNYKIIDSKVEFRLRSQLQKVREAITKR